MEWISRFVGEFSVSLKFQFQVPSGEAFQSATTRLAGCEGKCVIGGVHECQGGFAGNVRELRSADPFVKRSGLDRENGKGGYIFRGTADDCASPSAEKAIGYVVRDG